MLPSFRLIVITFACSFVLVFASLRLMESSRVINEPLSVPLAVLPHSELPVQFASLADRRRVDDAMPMMFDMRFGDGAVSPASVPASLTLHAIDRAKDQTTNQTRCTAAPRCRNARRALPIRSRSPGIDACPAPTIAAPPAATVEESKAAQPRETIDLLAPAAPVVPVVTAALEPPAAAPEPVAKRAVVPEPAMTLAAPEPVAAPIAPEPPVTATPEPPAAATLPEPTPIEPPLEPRIEIAALPDPTDQSIETPDSAEDLTASIDPDRRPPEAVPTAGTSRPAIVRKHRVKAKAKAVIAVIRATPKRKVRSRTVRRPATTASNTPPSNPFSTLFGSASQ